MVEVQHTNTVAILGEHPGTVGPCSSLVGAREYGVDGRKCGLGGSRDRRVTRAIDALSCHFQQSFQFTQHHHYQAHQVEP